MEWSEDLGGLRLRMRREPDSPQHIVLEFDVRDRDLLKRKPLLKIYAVTVSYTHLTLPTICSV